MFNNTKTDKERQNRLDDYMTNLIRKQKLRKKHKKIAENKGNSMIDNPYVEKPNKIFNSVKDFLVVKGFLTEQLTTGLKMNKRNIDNFITTLSSDDIYLLSNNLMDFQKAIKKDNQNINDYILKTSFNEYKKTKRLKNNKKETMHS